MFSLHTSERKTQSLRGGIIVRVISSLLSLFVLVVACLALYDAFRGVSLDQAGLRSGVAEMLGVKVSETVATLPAAADPKLIRFEWQYGGRSYALSETLYGSYYRFYRSLPTGIPLGDTGVQDRTWWAALDALFLRAIEGDMTISRLAPALRELGQAQKLSDDQLVELVAAFVQDIPYDQAKTDRREQGLDTDAEKVTYPYEVLYDQKGVCQDKSYLAYHLLQELGYGVAIFLFPDPADNHMAVGVRCPAQYSNYNSGYCFLETTGTGNKIGMIPELSAATRVATADIEIGDINTDQSAGQYQSLGRVEVINAIEGKEYTGIVATIKTRDELERLRTTIAGYRRELKTLGATVESEESTLEKYMDKLDKLKRQERYEDYNDLVEEYNDLAAKLKKHITAYNALVIKSNAAIQRYNTLGKSFYAD